MTESAHGIILRTRPLTDTSLIIHWLTDTHGRIATVAKGARRPKSPFAGKLDLFYTADFQFTRSRRSELHTLREVVLRDTHPALRQDLGWLQQAAYAAAFVEQTTETETPLPEVFKLVEEFIAHVPQQPAKPRSIYAFELKLLRELGLEPDAEETNLPAATQELLRALTETPFSGLASLKADARQAAAVRQFLHGFLIFHLGKLPKNRASVV